MNLIGYLRLSKDENGNGGMTDACQRSSANGTEDDDGGPGAPHRGPSWEATTSRSGMLGQSSAGGRARCRLARGRQRRSGVLGQSSAGGRARGNRPQ